MICLLVGSCKASEDQDVFVRYLVKATTFEADPIGIFFNSKIQRLPVRFAPYVVLFYEISSLASIKTCNHIER